MNTGPSVWTLFATSSASNSPGCTPGEVSAQPTPVVSRYLFENGFRPHYPLGKKFAVCLSHDIDHLYQIGAGRMDRFRYGARLLRSVNLTKFKGFVFGEKEANPYYNINEILAWERANGIRATYFFLALKEGEEDFNYDLAEQKSLIAKILSEGHEIGLHGGRWIHNSFSRLREEKQRIETASSTPVVSHRSHYLLFQEPNTWHDLANQGFRFDGTYGCAGEPGFRNGMCYPFFPWDNHRNGYLPVLEIPLHIMDATFIYHQKLTAKQALQKARELVNSIEAVQGVASILWHNNYFYGKWRSVLEEIISLCHEKNGWFCTHREIGSWWLENSYCESFKQYGLAPGR